MNIVFVCSNFAYNLKQKKICPSCQTSQGKGDRLCLGAIFPTAAYCSI